MRRVFNLGIGMVLAVAAEEAVSFEAKAESSGIDLVRIGTVTKRK